MNPAHLHLLVNHLPILGTALAIALLLLCWMRQRQAGLALAGALLLLASAGGAGAAMVTGELAEDQMEDRVGSGTHHLETHEEAAQWGWPLAGLVAIAGGALCLGSWRLQATPVAPALLASVTVASLTAAGAFAYIGSTGGKIMHPEVRSSGGLFAVAESPLAEPEHASDGDEILEAVDDAESGRGRGRGRGRGGRDE